MANTLKFGNGEWYGKKDTILAYNDENSNYKPLPFNFSRASKATVINKDGLIEEVGSNIPRIDFLGNTQGAFLLEPSRSNFYTQSNLFSFGGNVTSNNALSPDGTLNASKITKTSSSDQFVILPWSASLSTSTTYSLSFFVKHNGDDLDLRYESNNYNDWGATPVDDGGVSWNALFEVRENSVIASTVNNCTSNVINFGNGWYRVVVYVTTSSSITPTSPSNLIRVIGSDTKQFLMYGAMFEQGSYSTSLINTQGSTVTRLADSCNNGANEQVINSTEGVLYAEVSLLSPATSSAIISLSDGSSNRLFFEFFTANRLYAIIENGSSSFNTVQTITQTDNNKLAFKYSASGCKLYINGTGYSFGGLSFSSETLDTLNFASSNGTSSPFYGKTKAIAVYKEALTDAELQSLTTI